MAAGGHGPIGITVLAAVAGVTPRQSVIEAMQDQVGIASDVLVAVARSGHAGALSPAPRAIHSCGKGRRKLLVRDNPASDEVHLILPNKGVPMSTEQEHNEIRI